MNKILVPAIITNIWPSHLQPGDEKGVDRTRIEVKRITVLRKYPLKVVVSFDTRINRNIFLIRESSFMIAMDEEVFANFFPHTLAHLVFKKLLDDGKVRPRISFQDFTSKLPNMKYLSCSISPSLSYKKPYVIFMERSGFAETRCGLAQYLRILEAYEQKLKVEANG